jgi:hypothetical protein
MGKKLIAIVLAVSAFGFGTALRLNAGTDMIEPYRAPAPSYNYAPPPPPPPRPVVYFTPPVFGVVVGPGFGYYGRGLRLLRRPPVLRSTRLLARARPSLALTVAAGVDRGDQCSDSVLISGNPACFSC